MSKKLLYYKTVDMASIKPSYKGSLDGFKEDSCRRRLLSGFLENFNIKISNLGLEISSSFLMGKSGNILLWW